MLFSFHREARFASSSPDYDIFSQHFGHGFAYFNVNARICANQYQLERLSACTHTRSVKVTSAERSQLDRSHSHFGSLSESILFLLYLFLSKPSSGICYQIKSQAHHFKLGLTCCRPRRQNEEVITELKELFKLSSQKTLVWLPMLAFFFYK